MPMKTEVCYVLFRKGEISYWKFEFLQRMAFGKEEHCSIFPKILNASKN